MTTFKMGADVNDQQLGCLWQKDHLLSISLSGYINYLDKSNPDRPIRTIKVRMPQMWQEHTPTPPYIYLSHPFMAVVLHLIKILLQQNVRDQYNAWSFHPSGSQQIHPVSDGSQVRWPVSHLLRQSRWTYQYPFNNQEDSGLMSAFLKFVQPPPPPSVGS